MKKKPDICMAGGIFCKIDYPHTHKKPDGAPEAWCASVDDPAVPAKWPDRLYWKRPKVFDGRNPYHTFKFGWFASHSGFQLPWKIDLESGLDESDWHSLARLVAWKFAFRSVYGIPKGGARFAEALDPYCEPGYPVLIVDDVLTTGRSFIDARARLDNPDPCIGVVVVARGPCPDWVFPILQVNEFFQSRATGLG